MHTHTTQCATNMPRCVPHVCVWVVVDSPGLLHLAVLALTGVHRDVTQGAVDGGEVGPADVQEVGPHATHRHLGDVREGLADCAAKDEHTHLNTHTHTHTHTHTEQPNI